MRKGNVKDANPDKPRVADFLVLLKGQKEFLGKRFKVNKIGIFGSYVKNEQNGRSDLDILVELDEPLGYGYFDLKEYLEKLLHIRVDLVLKKGLKPGLRSKILKEVIYL